MSSQRQLNSLTIKKQTTKFTSANFQKMLISSCNILRIQRLEGKQCSSEDLDEVAHYEPPHQDLCCLQTHLHVFSSLVLRELRVIRNWHGKIWNRVAWN